MEKMEKTKKAWETYKKREFTNNFLVCFPYADNGKDIPKMYAYVTTTGNSDIEKSVKLDRASTKKGGSEKLRLQPSKAIKCKWVASGAVPFMTVVEFIEKFENWRKAIGKNYNQGEFFEYLVTTWAGEEWEKDNAPYTDAPDIWINEAPYQIKKDGAQIATLKQLEIE